MKRFHNLDGRNRVSLLGLAALLFLFAAVGEAQDRESNSAQSDAPAGNAENGRRLYEDFGCWACHGREGQGGVAGPRVGPDPIPFAVMTRYVRRPGGQMPPYTEQVVSDQNLADIYAFLRSLPQPRPVGEIPLLND